MKTVILTILCFILLSINICNTNGQRAIDKRPYSFRAVELTCSNLKEVKYIITSREEFKRLFCQCSSDIDFTTEILLGVYTSASGCGTPETSIEVTEFVNQKKVIFDFNIEVIGMCRRLFIIKPQWIVIRRPENDYKISIRINQSYI